MKRGFIFDVDGVIADTPHEEAWRESLRFLFREKDTWKHLLRRTSYSPERFTPNLYREQISGKTRIEGARSALAYFHVPDPDELLLKEYCETKQKVYLQKIAHGEFRVYDDAILLLLEAKRKGAKILAASSSKNAGLILDNISMNEWQRTHNVQYDSIDASTTLLRLFDGNVSGGHGRRSKPDPDIFLHAAASGTLTPGDCLVIEDAPNGVQAAKRGHFFCVGIARANNERELREANADIVTNDLRNILAELLL